MKVPIRRLRLGICEQGLIERIGINAQFLSVLVEPDGSESDVDAMRHRLNSLDKELSNYGVAIYGTRMLANAKLVRAQGTDSLLPP